MNAKNDTLLITGSLIVAGVTVVALAKGINQASGSVGDGLKQAVANVSSAVANDLNIAGSKAVNVGAGLFIGAGVGLIALFLLPEIIGPIILVSAVAGGGVLGFEASSGNPNYTQTVTVTDVAPSDNSASGTDTQAQ